MTRARSNEFGPLSLSEGWISSSKVHMAHFISEVELWSSWSTSQIHLFSAGL